MLMPYVQTYRYLAVKIMGTVASKIESRFPFEILPEFLSYLFKTSNEINFLRLSSIFLFKKSFGAFISSHKLIMIIWLMRHQQISRKMQNNQDLPKHLKVEIACVTKKHCQSFFYPLKVSITLSPLVVHCTRTGVTGTIQINKFIPYNLTYL